jgi:hypothetical protein
MRLGTRAKLNNDELIAFGPLKHLIPRFEKAGVTKGIKRKFNRRTRRKINVDIERDIVD